MQLGCYGPGRACNERDVDCMRQGWPGMQGVRELGWACLARRYEPRLVWRGLRLDRGASPAVRSGRRDEWRRKEREREERKRKEKKRKSRERGKEKSFIFERFKLKFRLLTNTT